MDRFCSMFRYLLQLFPLSEFQVLIIVGQVEQAKRCCKQNDCNDQDSISSVPCNVSR
jgi:hypothetical protein